MRADQVDWHASTIYTQEIPRKSTLSAIFKSKFSCVFGYELYCKIYKWFAKSFITLRFDLYLRESDSKCLKYFCNTTHIFCDVKCYRPKSKVIFHSNYADVSSNFWEFQKEEKIQIPISERTIFFCNWKYDTNLLKSSLL